MRVVTLARHPVKVRRRSTCLSLSTRSLRSPVRRMGAFEELHAIPPQMLADGYLARAVHGEQLTFAVVEIEPSAELPEHRHANEQFGMVIEGSVNFCVGDEQRTIGAGGIWRIPSDTLHSVTAGDA